MNVSKRFAVLVCVIVSCFAFSSALAVSGRDVDRALHAGKEGRNSKGGGSALSRKSRGTSMRSPKASKTRSPKASKTRSPKASKTSKSRSSSSVAVIGAGISGLTAAFNLKKLGYSVIMFEAESRVGGKIESVYLENGAPTSDAVSLTDDMESRAQALCGDKRPTDLGAVIATGPNIKALADELNIPYGDIILDNVVVVQQGGQTIKLSREQYLGFLADQINPSDPLAAINDAIQAFFVVVAMFPEIQTVRLDDGADGNREELALPTAEFAAKYGITLLVESLRPVVAGYGYGYFETVPAGIMLQYIFPIVSALVGQSELLTIGFPCGFQSILEAMAAIMDVRLNAKVMKIKRTNKSILVKATGQPALKFDHLVISTTLDLVPSFLRVGKVEAHLFSLLSFKRYISTATNTIGNSGDNEVQFYADQGFQTNINNVNIVAKGNITASAEIAYQIIEDGTLLEEAFEVLQDNMQTYWQATADAVIAQKDVNNYFPTVSSEDFAAGFYNSMEDLQGYRNTYYVGSQLSFETATFSEAYARDLILRKFVQVNY